MSRLNAHDVTVLFLSLGVLLGAARLLGELMRHLRQPAVMGEILVGVILGPTLFGRFFPDAAQTLFPVTGSVGVAMQGLSILAAALFLLVAGMEVDPARIWHQGRVAVAVGVSGVAAPFMLGFVVAFWASPWVAREEGCDPLYFALFFATALSITALPVIVRTLLDLDLLRTRVGTVVVAAAVFDDFAGWLIFAVILSLMGRNEGVPMAVTLSGTLIFAFGMITLGRAVVDRVLGFVVRHTTGVGSVVGGILTLAFFAAAFTEWVGVHAVFGSFIVGVAIGNADGMRERARKAIDDFVSAIFAPLFFAGIGLHVDFMTNFDVGVVLWVFVVACTGKIVGCATGAYAAGMPRHESMAVGLGMNVRGAMEIVLGTLGLHYGLIGERLFTALVMMAIATSMTGGPLMQWVLRHNPSPELPRRSPVRSVVAQT